MPRITPLSPCTTIKDTDDRIRGMVNFGPGENLEILVLDHHEAKQVDVRITEKSELKLTVFNRGGSQRISLILREEGSELVVFDRGGRWIGGHVFDGG